MSNKCCARPAPRPRRASVFVSAALLDGDTGVMCDATGHCGFSSFDNTLVLWGGGDPGTSCEDKEESEGNR